MRSSDTNSMAAALGAASCFLLGLYIGTRFKQNEGKGSRLGDRTEIVEEVNTQMSKRPRIKSKAYKIHQNWLKCDIVVAGNEKEYHRCVRLLSWGENALELGSHQGVTTRKIASTVGPSAHTVGIDMSEFSVTRARMRAQEENSTAQFFCGDARDIRFAREHVQFDVQVVFIDVSGNRHPSLLVQLIESYARCFKPRLIVVKSYKLENIIRLTKLSTEV